MLIKYAAIVILVASSFLSGCKGETVVTDLTPPPVVDPEPEPEPEPDPEQNPGALDPAQVLASLFLEQLQAMGEGQDSIALNDFFLCADQVVNQLLDGPDNDLASFLRGLASGELIFNDSTAVALEQARLNTIPKMLISLITPVGCNSYASDGPDDPPEDFTYIEILQAAFPGGSPEGFIQEVFDEVFAQIGNDLDDFANDPGSSLLSIIRILPIFMGQSS